jgi:protein-S-isoprenylcysteine O-methyltransferase Ste14
MTAPPWYRNTRGEWYVVVQVILLGLVAVTPLLWRTTPWPAPWSWLARLLGLALLLLTALVGSLGLTALSRNLSALPHPKHNAALVETGIYGVVRHPIYSALIAGCLGWALLCNNTPTLLLALAAPVLFDLKARREERALRQRFPAYARYQQRVRRFIPFIY